MASHSEGELEKRLKQEQNQASEFPSESGSSADSKDNTRYEGSSEQTILGKKRKKDEPVTGVLKRWKDDSGDTKGGGTGWQGLAVLITNTYENTDRKSLPGVAKDREELNETFCDPFFKVIEAQDATSEKMEEAIENGSKKVKKKEYKCVFIVFSGHGGKNSQGNECIISNDGDEIEVSGFVQNIIEKFGRGIPKVILIDACRGDKKLEDTKGPNDNCLVVFGTQEDYKAMAPKTGSYWIPVVARCLRETDDTVVNVIVEANAKVSTNPDLKKIQIPIITENSLTDQALCVYRSLDKGCQPLGEKSKRELPSKNIPGDKQKGEYLDTEPTMSELMNIIAININKKWKNFGLQLGLTNPVINRIDVDNGRNAQKFQEMFLEWRRRANPAYPYKWSTIDKALRNPTIDNKDLANKLDQEISGLKEYCVELAQKYSAAVFKSEPDLSELMEYVGATVGDQKYAAIGIELGLDASTIEGISCSPQYERMTEVFDCWMRRCFEDKPYTWQTLLTALEMPQVNLHEIADKIVSELQKKD